MNRYSDLDRKHPPRRIKGAKLPHHSQRYTYPTKMENSGRTTLDTSFIRTVSKEEIGIGSRFESPTKKEVGIGSRFEPPTKKPRPEGRDDVESSLLVARQPSRANHGSYRNPTMKSYKTIERLIIGAYENRDALVSSSLSAFWTRAACLLDEDCTNGRSSSRDDTLHDKLTYFFQRTEDTLEDFGSNNMSQTLTAFGKIVKQGREGSNYQVMFYDLIVGKSIASSDSIFLNVANVAVHRLNRYDPQALSTTAITFARIGMSPSLNDGSSLFDHIAFHSMRSIRHFNPQGLSTLVWAFATVQVAHTDLFKRVAEAALATLHRFNPQNLSNLAWAFAKTNQPSPRLFKKIASESIRYIGDSSSSCPQNIANTLWSFANLELYDDKLFAASAERMIDSVSDFNAQELANSASAFAFFGNVNHAVFKAIGDEATKQLTSFTAQNLTNICHAFVVGGVSHPKLFDKIAAEAMCRLNTFNQQELANLAWSYAKAKEFKPRLFASIAEEVLQRLNDFVEPQHLSNLIWAFATVKLPHKPLFQAIAHVAIQRKHEFSPQQVSNLIWSYCFVPVGMVNQLLHSFESVVLRSIGGCDHQFFANVAWSYAVANVDSSFLFAKESQFIKAIQSREHEFNLEAKCQIHQFILWRKELKTEIPLSPTFQLSCYNAYIKREPSPSAFQDHVMNEIKSLGLTPREEYLTSTGYSLDALIEINGEQVGVEVDGPFHFAGQGQPLGKMSLKHRQVLNVSGIRIVSIPYWEWEGCVNRKDYLKSKLNLEQADEVDYEFRWIL